MTEKRIWERVRRRAGCFFSLSRTPHAVLDLAGPAVTALLWLDRFPAWGVVAGGLVTTFAGYTAVYALNDLADCGEDRRRNARGCPDYGDYLDAKIGRHPVAQGVLSLRAGIAWASTWGAAALVGAFLLNPVCALIFACAAVLEVLYCKLARVTPLRVLVSGLVKTAGPVAGVLAVDPAPAPGPLLLLFAWILLWEIGGQNIPADWSDIDEDRALGFHTLPVRLATGWASRIAFACLAGAVAVSVHLGRHASLLGAVLYWAAAITAGAVLLLYPAGRLLRTRDRADALTTFNRASFYPAAMLGAVAVKVLLRF